MGPFSKAFDSISSEYGWTDEQILNLDFCRFRQISTAISQRTYDKERARLLEESAVIRILAVYIAQGYMVDGDNPAVEAAQKISLDPVEQEYLEKTFGQDTPEESANEPRVGSYETLMRLFSQKR